MNNYNESTSMECRKCRFYESDRLWNRCKITGDECFQEVNNCNLAVAKKGMIKMSEKELFEYYYNLISDEYREEMVGYESFAMSNVLVSIRVNFKNGSWIRVYQKLNGTVEWY